MIVSRPVLTEVSDTRYSSRISAYANQSTALHFKLSVPHVSAADFESAEFQYIPLLNEDRDRDLVAILPEYLTVEITFSRQQASKFYARVIDTLTKRRSSSGSG